MKYLETILKGIISGILSAYLVLYGLRPATPYPEYILETFENIWLFSLLFLIDYYLFLWDSTIAALFLLCIIGLLFDFIVFTSKGMKKELVITTDRYIEKPPEFTPVLPSQQQQSFYNVLINDIKINNNEIYPGGPSFLKDNVNIK